MWELLTGEELYSNLHSEEIIGTFQFQTKIVLEYFLI